MPTLGLALALLHAPIVQAQANAGGAADGSLPEVVVSGAGNHELADELPMSFDVLGADAWTDRQDETLGQALRDLPNTSVRSTPARLAVGAASSAFARDGNTDINIRGLGGNRVLMTVDGVRMPRSYVSRSAIFDREYLSLELYKRIELIRGPASALYGSDGMAGVVNFVTWDPWDFLRSADGGPARTVGGRVSTGWSQEDRGRSLAATVAGRASDNVQWMLTAAGRAAHGIETRGTNAEPNANRTVPNPERDRDQAVLGKLVLSPSATQRHVLSFEHTRRRSDIDLLSSRAPVPTRPNDVLDEQTAYTGQRDRLAWDGRFEPNAGWADSVRALLALQHSDSHRIGTSDLFDGTHRVRDNRYRERAWQAGLRADKVLRTGAAAHRITYGVDYVRNRITNLYDGVAPLPPETFPLKRFPDTRETFSALYLQDESIIGDWTLTPGLRFDHFAIDVTSQDGYYPPASQPGRSLSGSALSPKLGVLYRVTPAWSVYGQFATGFRAPEAGQLNDHFEALAPSPVGPPIHVVIQPNPDLKPEKSRGFELGVRGRLERLSLDVSAFSNRYRNLIVDAEFVEQVGTNRLFQSVNIGRARIHGFELKGRYDWGRVAGGELVSTFAWGMARGSNRSSGKPLNSIDPAQLSVGLRYDAARWSAYADVRHHRAKKPGDIDSTAIMNARDGIQFAPPSATTLDVGLQWRPRKDLRLNLGVRNLTNRKYWLWPGVYGVAGTSTIRDAYTQPGRSAFVSLVMDF
ncbi:MAG TPA: TonB-dependent hemoglobin/transferrin/lactoferrin family receptor [Ottowia sp.]|uniref:TonB-dependent hemoglobin/transferrin/lactoferrin family receptor n=1 Tax=Ottowia sp. TaxID=1898956 RepID=UPI002B8B827F|nr:TonB-dependent hemoglobin/transferrin/lactoferrin family receptor [Ottowia sp.]HMN20442.1 TonB-dependent hemoglobin/transferrin/lactoferrin family receptor [Ottowia sp.]